MHAAAAKCGQISNWRTVRVTNSSQECNAAVTKGGPVLLFMLYTQTALKELTAIEMLALSPFVNI